MANVVAPADAVTFADVVREYDGEWVLMELDCPPVGDRMAWSGRLLYHSPQRGRVAAKKNRLLKAHPELIRRLVLLEAYKPITTIEEFREAFRAAEAEGFASVIKRRRGLF